MRRSEMLRNLTNLFVTVTATVTGFFVGILPSVMLFTMTTSISIIGTFFSGLMDKTLCRAKLSVALTPFWVVNVAPVLVDIPRVSVYM